MLIILVLLPASVLFASDALQDHLHIIAYYTFDIQGSSSERLIREMIVPPQGDDPFTSVESMERALELKRNQLNNRRVFEEITWTYDVIHIDAHAVRYRVKFTIKDAFSFFAIPYPKYDSNYGFRLGLKAYDRNLFGSFADLYFVMNATQIDSSWSDWELFSELRISDIPVGDSRINLGGEIEGVLQDGMVHDLFYKANIDWRGINLAQTTFNFHVDIDENADTVENDLDKVLTTSFEWEDLPWFTSRLIVRPEFQFSQDTPESMWDIDNASFYTAVNPLIINGETYLFENKLTLKFPHEYLRSTTSLTLVDAKVFDLPISFWISADNHLELMQDRQVLYDNTYRIGASVSFSLPFAIAYRGSYELSFRDRMTIPTLNHVPMISTEQSFTFGSINWVGNFRRGLRGGLWASADYVFFTSDYQNLDYLNFTAQAELQTHLTLGRHLGMSFRGMGFFAHVPSFDWYENQSFPEFLPTRTVSASEALRGILDASFAQLVGTDSYQKLGAVANVDVTLMFIKFPRFAEGFISAFMDVGVFSPAVASGTGNNAITMDDLIILKTVGVEGYGIMNKFPSYPIRGSLGFNLDDVMRHFRGEIAFSQIEFELTIGMGLHY